MKMIGNRVDVGPKLDLPYEISLYSFDWLTSPTSAGLDMIALTQSGKVYFYKSENGKFKKVWSSRETYGGSPNAVAVNVKDFFNEVTASFYVVPVGIASIDSSTTPDLVVAKNDALLKDIVGRSPLISDGRLIRLKWDQLGFVEAWESKKVDGSIADYTVISTEGQLQLVAAVRLRDPGLLGDVGKKDSVLLVYNLN